MGDNIYHRNVDLISNLCKLILIMLEQRTLWVAFQTLTNVYDGAFSWKSLTLEAEIAEYWSGWENVRMIGLICKYLAML